MSSQRVRARLAEDVGLWVTDGLIRPEQAAALRERWNQPAFGLHLIVKYIGYSGGLFVMAGLLGLVAAASDSAGVAGAEMILFGVGLFAWGAKLGSDALGKYALSSRVVLAVGYIMACLGVATIAFESTDLNDSQALFLMGLLCAPAAIAVAYRLRNTFVLVLGLVASFHWVGSWTGMAGQGSYGFDIQDPRLMAAAATLAAAFGAVHERRFPRTRPAFAHAWGAVALTYVNLSLLILSVESRRDEVPWILAWALAGIAQILVGARTHSALFTGFGVTALALNLFSRYFDYLWEPLDAGLFFLGGGAILFGAGFGFETLVRKRAL